jgi:predicted nucleic acid-binding protein
MKRNKMTYCIDASVAIKWFKDDEEFSKEAKELFRRITDSEVHVVANEWISLEIIRAMMKSKFPPDIIRDTQHAIDELMMMGAIKKLTVSETKTLAEEIEIQLNLYAADSIHLATAIVSASSIFLTDDSHFLSQNVKEFAKDHKVEIKRLNEIAVVKK